MTTIDTYGSFEEAVAASPEHARVLARALRALIGDVYPGVVEVPWPNQQVIGYGVGPKKMTEHFCYIGAHSTHVNLGFNYGTDLEDPDDLLEGTGKKFRHVKIQHLDEVARPALRALLKTAAREREQALGRG